MLKKEELLQFRGIRRELLILRSELRDLETLELATAAVSGGSDARIRRLRSKIIKRASELTEKFENFNDYISSVEDPFDRSALTLRYFYGMKWQQVAFSLGEYDEQYARRRCEKYYLQNEGI